MSDPQFNSVETNSLESVGKGRKMANKDDNSNSTRKMISKVEGKYPKTTKVISNMAKGASSGMVGDLVKYGVKKYQNRKTTAGK